MAAMRFACHLVKYRNFSFPRCAYFCSASAPSTRRCFFPDEEEGQSAVYAHAMKFQRPSVMKWSGRLSKLENRVSFIGTVYSPIKVYEMNDGPFGVLFGATTFLDVKTSHDSSSSFRISLQMYGDMARMCSQHLKPKDCIYVSGQLERIVGRNDVKQYKLIVNELNYVMKPRGRPASPACHHSEPRGETPFEKYKSRLHLWQLFFSNPHEWWDNRKSKKNPRAPDFKHKDTGEALWISANDPPWVATQLQLHDSSMAEHGHMRSHYSDTKPGLSKWKPDDSVWYE